MPERISILTPTRGRPEGMIRLYDSAMSTARHASMVEFLFYIDKDDSPDTFSALQGMANTRALVGPRKKICLCWNDLFFLSDGDLLMMGNDDSEFVSEDWDDALVAALEGVEDRVALLYGKDGINDEALATHPVVTREWVDAIGYFCPPFMSFMNDTWLDEIARAVGRGVYVPEFVINHRHFSVGKSEFDETYRYAREVLRPQENPAITYKALADMRVRDADRIRRRIMVLSDRRGK